MNRTNKIVLSLLALLCCITMTAQTAATKCEYWIDRQMDSRITTAATAGEWTAQIDVSSLPAGVHSIAFRAGMDDGRWSAIHTKFFVVPQTHSTEENTLASYEYWIDRKFNERVSGTFAAGGVVETDLDFPALSPGVHSLSFRVLDANGHSSSVLTKFFLVPQTHSTEENTLASYEYWIDRKFNERVSGTFAAGGVVETDLDMSALSPGVHSLSFRVLDTNGHSSSVLTKNFIVPQSSGTIENSLVAWRYWIDRDETSAVEEAIDASGIIDLDLDLATLKPGPHVITYQVKDAQGHYSAAHTSFFTAVSDGETTEGDKIVAYEYWFNNNPRKRVEVEPNATLELNDVMLDVEGVEPEAVPADYQFDVATKKVSYTQNVEFGLQVFNNLGTGSAAVTQTIDGYTTIVDPQFVELSNEAASTKPAPTGCGMQGYLFNSEPGQREYWFMELGESQKVDFYDADGVLFNDQVQSVDILGKQALTFLAPTSTVYALTYGATEGEADNTVKVALPVSITINNAERKYGDDNPEFTFTSEQADLIMGTPVMTTTANKKSGVGDYAITLDQESIGNTIVNVTDGTLTIGKAMLTITAEDKVRVYGEDNPELTWTAEGIKNYEDIDIVCTAKPTCATEATSASDAGEYAISVSGGEAANYDFTYVGGKLTVGKAPLDGSMITLSKNEYEYNASDRQPTVFVTWNDKELVKGMDFDVEYSDNHNAGVATVIVTGKGNFGESAEEHFTITKAKLTVTADDKEMFQEREMPELTFTFSGWKGSDDESVITTLPTAYTNATVDSDVGDYAIVVSGGEADNYDFTYVDGKLTVIDPAGVANIRGGEFTKPTDVYNLQGAKVATKITSLKQLPEGTYIIRGKKVVVKH